MRVGRRGVIWMIDRFGGTLIVEGCVRWRGEGRIGVVGVCEKGFDSSAGETKTTTTTKKKKKGRRERETERLVFENSLID